jgi:hypothetical protein
MLDADGEVVGVASVLDPVVDEASDWTLHVLGTIAGLTAMVVSPTRASPQVSDDPLSRLGSEVLHAVDAWRAMRPGDGT